MDKKNPSLWILLPLGLLLTIGQSGCYYDNEEELYPVSGLDCDTISVSYAATVSGILTTNCYECHSSANSTTLGSGIVLEGYNNVKIYIDNGRLLCAIRHDPGCSQMPKGKAQLLTCDISKIKAWANSGAPNN